MPKSYHSENSRFCITVAWTARLIPSQSDVKTLSYFIHVLKAMDSLSDPVIQIGNKEPLLLPNTLPWTIFHALSQLSL